MISRRSSSARSTSDAAGPTLRARTASRAPRASCPWIASNRSATATGSRAGRVANPCAVIRAAWTSFALSGAIAQLPLPESRFQVRRQKLGGGSPATSSGETSIEPGFFPGFASFAASAASIVKTTPFS